MADILVPTKFLLATNVSDGEILSNLRASKARNLPYVDIAPVRYRPLAIVGSGPSLLKYIESLRYFPGDIMALNGAAQVLLENGIVPKYSVLLDARAENVNFFDNFAPTTYHLLASQVHPAVYDLLIGLGAQVATFHLDGPSFRAVFDPTTVTHMGAMHTVGLTALIVSTTLGYRRLHLYGYDSSHSGGASHARPQSQNEGGETTQVEFAGKWYTTTPAMASQVEHFFVLKDTLLRNYPDVELYLCGEGLFYDFVLGNNKPSTPEGEVAKYANLYDDDHYGMSAGRYEEIGRILHDTEFEAYGSFLDVGTGRGETLEIAEAAGFKQVWGTETVDKLLTDRVFKAILPKLPFPDKSVDVVTCFEVLEHIHPNDLPGSLRELARVACQEIIVSVCTRPDVRGGVNLHPSAMSSERWEAALAEQTGGTVLHAGEASIEAGVSPIYRVVL